MAGEAWWRHSVIYQVYPRSFADGNRDGDGDLAGLRARLPYLVELGVDGIWMSPWYPSPMADGGYDVSDFTGIHPMFGTLEEADALLAEVKAVGHRRGIPGRHPDAVHTELDQIRQPDAQAREVTVPVAVPIREAARVDLVDH